MVDTNAYVSVDSSGMMSATTITGQTLGKAAVTMGMDNAHDYTYYRLYDIYSLSGMVSCVSTLVHGATGFQISRVYLTKGYHTIYLGGLGSPEVAFSFISVTAIASPNDNLQIK